MPADRDQAPADKCNITRGIEHGQFTHRIDKKYFGRRLAGFVELGASRVVANSTELAAAVAEFIVDVLNSQFALYRAITLFYQSRYDYLMNYLRLKEAAGDLTIQDLEVIDRWLVDRPTPEEKMAAETES